MRSLLSRPFNILTFELPVSVILLEHLWLIVKLKLSARMYGSRILKFLWSSIMVATHSSPDEKKD